MAKKSQKQQVRPKRDNAGCMSGLISMFDFRQGRYTRRLLSDKKFGSRHGGSTVYSRNQFDVLSDLDENHEDSIDADAKSGRLNLSKASIKALMEEEMSGAYTSIGTSEVNKIKSEIEFEPTIEKNHEHSCSKINSDHDANDSDQSSPLNVNFAEIMAKFCTENNKCQEINAHSVGDRIHNFASEADEYRLKHSILHKALSDLTKIYLDQKSMNPELGIGNEESQSKEFVDALENLNSRKELLLKLLQDPDRLPMKHILELQNGQIGECLRGSEQEEKVSRSMFNKQSGHYFFWRKEKSKEAQTSNRIIVLKPSPGKNQPPLNTSPTPLPNDYSPHHQDKERVSSHFSLKEIKRRLRNMIGESKKERHLITMEAILHKVPYGFQNSGDNTRSYCSPEHASQVAKYMKGVAQKENAKERQPQKWENARIANPLYRDPDLYTEAKKHLAEMVKDGEENDTKPTFHASITLGRMLELPGYNIVSPRLSPRRANANDSPENMRLSPLGKLECETSSDKRTLRQSTEHSPSIGSNKVYETEVLGSNSSSFTAQLSTEQGFIRKGNTEIEECDNVDAVEDYNTIPGSLISELGPYEEPQEMMPSTSFSHNCIIVQKDVGDNTENRDRPSPVSVLELPFVEFTSSPEKMTIDYAGLIEPRQLHFEESDIPLQDQTSIASEVNLRMSADDKEAKLRYVRTVLQASGLKNKQFAERWKSSDQLLDPFVYDELEISFDQQIDDSRLLFDCVNEILVVMHERYIDCSPWASFIRPNIRPMPSGANFVEEVCERFAQHLHLQSRCMLDQIVQKDLDGKTWMNVQFEAEDAIAEVGEVILDYILEETILELWD